MVMNARIPKMPGILSVVGQRLASQEGLRSMKSLTRTGDIYPWYDPE
jgi:hypothetical protein